MNPRLPLLAVLLLVGCRTTIDQNDYDRQCRVDADCVLAIAGNLCQPCVAPSFTPVRESQCNGGNLAINVSESSRYSADYKAIKGACGPDFTFCPAACAPPVEAFCNSGTCMIRSAPLR